MEDSKDVDFAIILDEVSNAVVAVEQYADITRRGGVTSAELRKPLEILGTLIDTLDGTCSRLRIVGGNVLIDIVKPALSLFGPAYFCHDRMRRPISSFEIVRLASESASPRSTMT